MGELRCSAGESDFGASIMFCCCAGWLATCHLFSPWIVWDPSKSILNHCPFAGGRFCILLRCFGSVETYANGMFWDISHFPYYSKLYFSRILFLSLLTWWETTAWTPTWTPTLSHTVTMHQVAQFHTPVVALRIFVLLLDSSCLANVGSMTSVKGIHTVQDSTTHHLRDEYILA